MRPQSPLSVCPYCRALIDPPPSFTRAWHLGGAEPSRSGSCCAAEQLLTQQPQPAQAPATSGPIAIAGSPQPPPGRGQTSPLVITDESMRPQR